VADQTGGLAGSATAAAALAAQAQVNSALNRDPALHLLRRASFGPTPDSVAAVRSAGLDAWISAQLSPDSLPDATTDAVLAGYPTLGRSIAEIRATVKTNAWDAMYELGHATLARQFWSSRQLFEVMTDFWSNHLNVACPIQPAWDNRGVYDREVIRANALGRFSDMLLACARSPAMLRYLNNNVSDRRSVNENYGRELLELHTVGTGAGYTESDVRNSAYVLTGRTVDAAGGFAYDPKMHWTGPVSVLGFSSPNSSAADGLALGDAYLTYLAKHPSTAATIARKLAVRFVSDNPPAALVDRLARAYLDNGTAIAPVLWTLFRSVEFWLAVGQKTRRPLENLVASARVLGVAPGTGTNKAVANLYWLARKGGQEPLGWEPPNGYPDVAAAWNSANGVLVSWNAHRTLSHGWFAGLTYTAEDKLLPTVPSTVGGYLDALADRLLFQPLAPAERTALLAFLTSTAAAKPKNATLGGMLQHLVPLLLDSLSHGLR
jgi:uncharacterized protein (DUF1800 family)